VNVSSKGVRQTVSIPGTGLSHTSFSRRTSRRRQLTSVPHATASAPSAGHSNSGQSFPTPTTKAPLQLRADPATITPLDDAAVITVTKQWAERHASVLGRFITGGITDIDYRDVDRYRATYTIESRRVVVRTEPLARKVKATGVLASPASFDPWAESIAEQLSATRTLATCPTCRGEGRHRCPACAGSGDLLCDACGATGTVISDRSGNSIKCRTCGGDGRRRCPCRDGIVSCDSCNGKGVATVWLEVESTSRVERRTDGDPRFVASGATEEIAANVERIGGAEGTRDTIGSTATALLERPALQVGLNTTADRERRVEVQHEQSAIAVVRYTLAGREGELAIEGWSGNLKAEEGAVAPLRALHSRLWLGAIAAFCASGLLALWFPSRHWYYASSPIAGILALGPFLLPLAVWPFLVYRSRPAQNRDAYASLVALVPAVTIVVAQALLAATGPSLQRAQELAATGHPREAMLEAKASAELGINADKAKVFHDALLLKEVEKNANPSSVWPELAAATFLTEGSRHEAERHALGVTEHRADTLLLAGEYPAVLSFIGSVPMPFRTAASLQERKARAEGKLVETEWATIGNAALLADRVKACQAIQPPLKELGNALSDYASVSAGQIDKACAKADAEEKQRLRLVEAAAAAAQLKAAQAGRAAEARVARNARAWSTAPLSCNDGTLSPSCVCGGSHRGCCSHHGGVAGCSAPR
jgi:hypothetical protein